MEIRTKTWVPKQIVASGDPEPVGVTIDSESPALEAGTVLGMVTATGKYVAYDDEADDGREFARGVLAEHVDVPNLLDGQLVRSMFWRNAVLYESELIGLDDAAKADLGGKSLPSHNLFAF